MARMLPKSVSARYVCVDGAEDTPRGDLQTMFVPVVDKHRKPLMPTKPSRTRRWIREGKATPFWKNGVFCVRLNIEPSDRYFQDIAVGVDPGSKKEGFTVKSESHTYLNVQADAHTHTKKNIESRRNLRRGRRSRNKPNRKNRTNRLANKKRVPPSTRSRWQWKLRILDWLSRIFPVTHVCVEDIAAMTMKGKRRWNASFSPLEVGKQWFYGKVAARWILLTLKGYETQAIRDRLGLRKSRQKTAESFNAHCVDSWCLAYHVVGGEATVDNSEMLCIAPFQVKRRTLHRQRPQKGGVRPRFGGTMHLGIVKNTLVKHWKYGVVVVCGSQRGGLSLQPIQGGKRLALSVKVADCKILTRLNFRWWKPSSKTKASQPVGERSREPVQRLLFSVS